MTIRQVTGCLALSMTFAALVATASAQRGPESDKQFQTAYQKEMVDGNLKAAIEDYRKISTRVGVARDVAAKALLRMAECYQKLGDLQARKIYEQVVREYTDQKEAVTLARARLGKDTEITDSRMTFREVWKLPADNLTVDGTVSRDGRYVAYVDWAQNGNLFLHDLVQGTDRRLTDTATDNLPLPKVEQFAEETSFSRDGTQLAYSWFRDNRYELRLIDLKGNGIPQSRLIFDNPDVEWIAAGDWSPDGKSMAVRITRTDKTGQIGLLSVSGALRVLKSVEWQGTTMVVFSPDGKYLAYDLPAGGNLQQRDIFVLAIDGSREVPAVAGPGQDTVIGWSNDGKRLLFTSDRSGSMGLWSAPFVGGKVEGPPEAIKRDIGRISNPGLTDAGKLMARVDTSGGDVYVSAIDFSTGKVLSPPALAAEAYVGSNQSPAWSRDGKFLAYASTRGSVDNRDFVMAIRSLETGEVREISPTPDFGILNSLDWAPDGLSLIVKGRDQKGRYGIFRVDAQTGRSSILVTQGEREVLVFAGISPDGKKVYYSSRHDATDAGGLLRSRSLIEKDLTTGSEKTLLRTYDQMGSFLSPDGRYLALGSDVPSRPSVRILATGGGEPRELAGDRGTRQFQVMGWTADSSAVYVRTAPGEVSWVPIDGSGQRKLDLKWEGSNPGMGSLRVHPDGRRIAFERAARKPAEIWVLENFLPASSAKK